MDARLFITIVGYAVSAVVSIGFGLFIWLRHPKKNVNILFFLMSLGIGVFQISHVLGVTAHDPDISRRIFMFNLANLFIGAFLNHWLLIMAGREQKFRFYIIFTYAAVAAALVYFTVRPLDFLLPSVPKLYLPYYYNPGPLNLPVRLLFISLMPAVGVLAVLLHYRETQDPVEKNRMRYVLMGVLWGLLVGWTAVPLIHNIPFDPIWSLFLPLYASFLGYAIFKYELYDIRVVAKQAFFSAVAIGFTGLAISILNFSNNWLLVRFPEIPGWAFPLVSSVIAVIIGYFVFSRIRESDVLKYEFITVITHKFRGPLTHIKWTAESLLEQAPQFKEDLERIKSADKHLVELTNLLLNLSGSQGTEYLYAFAPVELRTLGEELAREYAPKCKDKRLSFTFRESEPVTVHADQSKVKVIAQVLLDNALSYTPPGGSITLTVYRDRRYGYLEVADSGIGISSDALPRMFKQFYRSQEARKTDTEGMGIGLSIAQDIAKRQNGKIIASSDGIGKGSKFTLYLPREKS